MWSSEVERIGFQKCTPTGYRLKVLGGYLFFAAFLVLIGTIIGGLIAALNGDFGWRLLLWALPFPALIILGIVCKVTASTLADRCQFEYDYEADEAKWNDGQPRSLTHDQWVADGKTRPS